MSFSERITSELIQHNLCNAVYNTKNLTGGCISNASLYSTDKGDYFVKTNSSKEASKWFRAEYLALERMHHAIPSFSPRPIYHGTDYIVTEYVSMSNRSKSLPEHLQQLGRSLSKLHSSLKQEQFGFDVISFCGTTALDNTWNNSWSSFWKNQRMKPLLAQVKGQDEELDTLGQELCSRLDHWLGPDVLSSVTPVLLHGDLWSGNWSVRNDTHQPFIFDPASYYGHYEAEFGIMKMFGGFGKDFFDAYNQATDLTIQEEGTEERLIIYELYHHLNHYAMFGGSYGSSCTQLLEKIL